MAALSNTGAAGGLLHCLETALVVKKHSGFSTIKMIVFKDLLTCNRKIAGLPYSLRMWFIAAWLWLTAQHLQRATRKSLLGFKSASLIYFVRKRIRAARGEKIN